MIKVFILKNGKVLREKIKKLLLELKFDIYSKGTYYLIEAIILAVNNPDLIVVLNELYKKIANKYNKNSTQIRRSIIGSIDVMNNHISSEQLHSFFHIYNNEKVSPKYFFTVVIEYFNNKK